VASKSPDRTTSASLEWLLLYVLIGLLVYALISTFV
jgi:hypothetical protein